MLPELMTLCPEHGDTMTRLDGAGYWDSDWACTVPGCDHEVRY
jgi:hypothetical protein